MSLNRSREGDSDCLHQDRSPNCSGARPDRAATYCARDISERSAAAAPSTTATDATTGAADPLPPSPDEERVREGGGCMGGREGKGNFWANEWRIYTALEHFSLSPFVSLWRSVTLNWHPRSRENWAYLIWKWNSYLHRVKKAHGKDKGKLWTKEDSLHYTTPFLLVMHVSEGLALPLDTLPLVLLHMFRAYLIHGIHKMHE